MKDCCLTAAHHDTDIQKYRCSLVKWQINYNKEKDERHKFWYMQTTPDDGLWKVQKPSGQFW